MSKDNINFKDYLNNYGIIEYGIRLSLYRGKLVGIRNDKICFNPTTILSRDGNYVACCKSNPVRWFKKEKIISIKKDK